MKNNTLIELGSIVDIEQNSWEAYAAHVTFSGRGEDTDVVVEDITLEYQSGDSMMTLCCPSLSEMPDRFSQRQVNALELHILNEYRISHQAYLQDLRCDLQRGIE